MGECARSAAEQEVSLGTYRRSGHWRRGRNGGMHWVSEHSVTRGSSSYRPSSSFSWSSVTWSPPSRPSPSPPPAPVRYVVLPYSSRWQKPNAQCPVCGSAVYFWSNPDGSRVYFDEMGPPWPKHPCTDARLDGSTGGVGSRPAYKMRSMPGQTAHAFDFRQRFDAAPAQAYEIEDVLWNGYASWLHVRRVGWWRRTAVFVVPCPVPRVPGHLIFVSGGRLSFLHPETLQVLDFPVVTGRQAEQQHEERLSRGEGWMPQ
jgi:hypothetical protein